MRRLLPALFAALALPCAAAGLTVSVSGAGGAALPGAVVFLESPAAAQAVRPLSEQEIGQQNKTFMPDQLVITRGTAVSFPNRDTTRHHVYSFSPTKVFEIKLYIGTPAAPVAFDKAGIGVLGCNIHDHMVAWVVIVDTPWFATADAGGRAVVKNAPPGDYRLRVWHRGLPPGSPPLDQALKLPASGASITANLAGVRP
ncbi:MAG: methylamine utilization protein [Pseudazoarcus pumilus]|nr:methylamine utilization protein [Pseudazoarcus pumilus]